MANEAFLLWMDVETTGLDESRDVPIEIACILCDMDCQELQRFRAKLIFDATLMTAEAAAINGYSAAKWLNQACPFSDWLSWLIRHVPEGKTAVPAGQNVSFDLAMIRNVARRYQDASVEPAMARLSYHKIDTAGFGIALSAVRAINPESVRLDSVARALGLHHVHHDPESDCAAAMNVYRAATRLMDVGAAAARLLHAGGQMAWLAKKGAP